MLAGELALAGVDVVVVERRASQGLEARRAGGLHMRTIEVLDQRGIADRFISAGQTYPHLGYGGTFLEVGDFPTRHNYLLGLGQSTFEPILAEWVLGVGVPILWSREVMSFAQDESGVDVEVSDGQTVRVEFLVGCDGGRSLIRKESGIDFEGLDASTSWMIAEEVEMTEDPQLGFHRDEVGTHAIGPAGDGKLFGLVLTEREVEHDGEPTIDDLRDALVGIYETDFGLRSANRISRFTDMVRQAASYRDRRVLLAGDAAHVHPPMGGQGLNIGVQDAVNLGWKLAQVIHGTSPDSLLDTYHAERHPVGAAVLHNTKAQVALGKSDDRHAALRDTMNELLAMDEPRKRIVGMISGLDIHYDLGEGHPLLGRRMPDLDLETAEGSKRLFTWLHAARPVLLNLSEPGALDITPWADRVQMVDAVYGGPWELPVIGEIEAPSAVLIRPDGYVAWVGDVSDPLLPDSINTWFGPPG